jgi:hypothetical protein
LGSRLCQPLRSLLFGPARFPRNLRFVKTIATFHSSHQVRDILPTCVGRCLDQCEGWANQPGRGACCSIYDAWFQQEMLLLPADLAGFLQSCCKLLCMTCVQSRGVSCEQYAGEVCGHDNASVFEQVNILHGNQPLTKNSPHISTDLRTNFVCNFRLFFRQSVKNVVIFLVG